MANKQAKADTYPLPKVEDLLASLGNSKQFSKLDLAHVYTQILLDDDSKKFVTINSHKGLYVYNRLLYEAAAAPSVFQCSMEGILRGMSDIYVYLDDILIGGDSKEKHLQFLDEALSHLEAAGINLKPAKCSFMKTGVEYLGHKISSAGIQPTERKV